MANIVITNRCNLHCPYCFASDTYSGLKDDIAFGDFVKALSFLKSDGPNSIGLIGGEPTLHPNFPALVESVIHDEDITSCTIFTNGTSIKQHEKLLVHPKMKLLINWNSPEQIGADTFNEIRDGVDELMFGYHMADRINIGLNLYSSDFDYKYAMDLLRRYDLHRVRISLTVPRSNHNMVEFFAARKDDIFGFLQAMRSISVLPYFDCNAIPRCIWSEDEIAWIEEFLEECGNPESNLLSDGTNCAPVIDIMPNLNAARCFGLSDQYQVPIVNFRKLSDLYRHFALVFDAVAPRIPGHDKCTSCYERMVGKCFSGCLKSRLEEFILYTAEKPLYAREET